MVGKNRRRVRGLAGTFVDTVCSQPILPSLITKNPK